MKIKEKFFLALSFALPLALYGYSLPNAIGWKDSGEFTSFSVGLGIAHPAGYPLWMLLGKLASLIPAGTLAWRTNLVSACFAAGSCSLFYLLVCRLGRVSSQDANWRCRLLFLLLTLVFALSRTVWSFALVAEAYSLFYCALMVLLLVILSGRSHLPDNGRQIVLFGFLAGILAGGHLTLLFYLPLLLAFHLISRKSLSLFYFLHWGMGFIIGISIYLYLPLRASGDPVLNWGNPSSPSRLLAHLLGTQYWGRALSLTPELWLFRLTKVAAELVIEVPFFLLPLVLFLLFRPASLHSVRWFGYLCLAIILVNVWFFVRMPAWVPHLFLPTFLSAFLLVALGMMKLMRRQRWGTVACVLLMSVAVGVQAVRQSHLVLQTNNELAQQIARQMLSVLPPHCTLVVENGNTVNAVIYLQEIEGLRSDCIVLEPFGSYYSQACAHGFRLLDSQWWGSQSWPLFRAPPAEAFTRSLLGHLRTQGQYFADFAFVVNRQLSSHSRPWRYGIVEVSGEAAATEQAGLGLAFAHVNKRMKYLLDRDHLRQESHTLESLLALWHNATLYFYLRGLSSEAQQSWHVMLSYDPEHFEALLQLAIAYDENGETEKAQGLWRQLTGRFPDAASVHAQYATFLLRHQRNEEAMTHLELAQRLSYDDPQVLYNLVQLNLTSGHLDLAQKYYQLLVKRYPYHHLTDRLRARFSNGSPVTHTPQ